MCCLYAPRRVAVIPQGRECADGGIVIAICQQLFSISIPRLKRSGRGVLVVAQGFESLGRFRVLTLPMETISRLIMQRGEKHLGYIPRCGCHYKHNNHGKEDDAVALLAGGLSGQLPCFCCLCVFSSKLFCHLQALRCAFGAVFVVSQMVKI